MSHMVIYRSVEGKPGFQQTDDLVSAVEFVERLRNLEGVESARIYRLEQVNFRFQPYYQVHIETEESQSRPPQPVPATTPLQPSPLRPALGDMAYAPPQDAPSAAEIEEESQMLAAGPLLAPVVSAEAAPLPPPVPTAAMAAASGQSTDEPGLGDLPEPEDTNTPAAGGGLSPTMAPPVDPPAEVGGVRRGLFNR